MNAERTGRREGDRRDMPPPVRHHLQMANFPEADRGDTAATRTAGPSRTPAGWESAMVVRVPALEPTLKRIRERFDLPRKPHGIPAHVTVLVPFLPLARIDDEARAALQEIAAGVEPFEVRFARTGRFPTVLYFDPEPADVFRGLTEAITNRWPELKPYAGAHKEPIPHLTITTSRRRSLLKRVATAVEPLLPMSARVDSWQLYRFDGRRWTELASFPLGSSPADPV